MNIEKILYSTRTHTLTSRLPVACEKHLIECFTCVTHRLTLLLTSLSFGKISKVKPSACPRDRLPPFMKLPKASTRPSTCSRATPLWRVWCTHTYKLEAHVRFKLTDRKENETRRPVTHLAYSLKDFDFTEDRGDTFMESGLEQDAEHPFREIGDLR